MTGWQLVFTIIGIVISLAGLVTVIFFRTLDKVSESSKWRGEVDSDRNTFEKFMDEVRDDLREIRADIKKIFERLGPAVVAGSSPLSLTSLGEQVSQQLGAKDWINEIVPNLLNEVRGKSPFEVQQFSLDFMKEEFQPNREQKEMLQNAAYEHGLKLEQVMAVLGVELRDALLEVIQQPGRPTSAAPEPSPEF